MRGHWIAAMAVGVALAAAPEALAGDYERLSSTDRGYAGNGFSSVPVSSNDGSVVAFQSTASNLVAGDTNGRCDVFVHDGSTLERVSVSSAGTQSAGSLACGIRRIAISADGRLVGFASDAPDLVAGDDNGVADVFVHDRATGQTRRVSVRSDGGQADGASYDVDMSSDGRYVGFYSEAGNLVPEGDWASGNVYLHDLHAGTTEAVAVTQDGGPAYRGSDRISVSNDGRFVAFVSSDDSLVDSDRNEDWDVFVRDRVLGTTEIVSLRAGGGQAHSADGRDPSATDISDDGRFVTFAFDSEDLVPGDANQIDDVYLRDRQARQTTLVSVDGAGHPRGGGSPSISANGARVAFHSRDGDPNEVFVFESGSTFPVTRGISSYDYSAFGHLSGDGRKVVFMSRADWFAGGDNNAEADVYRREATPAPAPVGPDRTPPVIVTDPVVANATSPNGADVFYEIEMTDTDPHPQAECSPPPGSHFPIGDTSVGCMVWDIHGNYGSAGFTLHVAGAAEQLVALRREARQEPGLGVAYRVGLIARLETAAGTIEDPNLHSTGCSAVRSFEEAVRRGNASRLSTATATRWLADASRIRAVATC